MRCIRWQSRFSADNPNLDSLEWSGAFGYGQTSIKLDPGAWMGSGYYQFRAVNGSPAYDDACAESEVVKIVQVNIEPVMNSECSPLQAGYLCTNAQECCRKAKWLATVKPAGTQATVSAGGPVNLSPTAVSDGQEVLAESTGEDSIGPYSVTITHNDCGDCPVTNNNGMAFKLYKVGPWFSYASGASAGTGYYDINSKAVTAGALQPGGPENDALLEAVYQFKIMSDPAEAYAGSVKVQVEMEATASGFITIHKKQPPPSPYTEAVSVSFGPVSWSISHEIGNENFGEGLASTDLLLSFLDYSHEHGDFAKSHKDISGPYPPLPGYKDGVWSDSLNCQITTPPTVLSVGVNYSVSCTIGAASEIGEEDSVLVCSNQRTVDDVQVEINSILINIP